jgi:hypothetical protein
VDPNHTTAKIIGILPFIVSLFNYCTRVMRTSVCFIINV